MYALLCRKLYEEAPNFDPPGSTNSTKNNTFCRLLLAKCKDEFENRRRVSEDFDKKDGILTAEEEEQRSLAKHKMLGNIKFIGELGKQGLLHEAILHQCIQQLLAKKKRQSLKDNAEDLECLCQIMKTVGRRLDIEKAKALMNQYFDRMRTFANNNELPSRIRFMLQDVLELRQNKWIPRRVLSDHGPKTIQQIREEAARDYGVYIPPPSYGQMMRNAHMAPTAILGGNKGRGGMDDVFGLMPLGVGSLGTGPGVIPTDFPAYSSNIGRSSRGSVNNTSFLGGGPAQSFFGPSRPNQNQNRDRERDRDMFSAYSSQQRQQNLNQQPVNFSGGVSNRDLPPRFMKKAMHSPSNNLDEISLRPAQNSMMLKPKPTSGPFTKLSPNNTPVGTLSVVNNPLSRDAAPGQALNTVVSPLLQKETSIVIKQVPQDKNKINKQGPSREEVLKKLDDFMNDLLNHQNIDGGLTFFKDIKAPKKYMPEILSVMMIKALEKSESDRELISRLMTEMKKCGMLTGVTFVEALKSVFQQMSELESEIPRVKSFVAGFAARGISDDLSSLSEVADPLESGNHYPLFLLCLQQLHKSRGRSWLIDVFNQSKVNLLSMLPEIDRTKERLADILEDRGLNFLFPLLRIQSDLWKQIQADASPSSLYRWIKDNVDSAQHGATGFVNALVSCLIKYITQQTTLADGLDRNAIPDKNMLDKEKELLEKFKPVFQAFLHEHPDLQLIALYALQIHCYNHSFPKGMLLRWFVLLYDLEVVEEEAFLKWKEDVNDEFPGKGKALFQVNQWLTWLEEAEEEEGSDDGDN